MAKRKTKEVKKIVENIINVDIAEANKQSYLNYAMTAISDRAIPNVLDGLKPVQRRILYAMNDLKLYPNRDTMKSQRVEGDIMGKYHPHSGSYKSIDLLTHKYEFHLPPIYGHGGFKDIIGNPAAAARYTEVKLTNSGYALVSKSSPKLVTYEPNYDNTRTMPKVLPTSLPYLLINGVKNGIAVGLSATIPPHNPVAALKLVKAYIKKPTINLDRALKILGGPDFPTGGVLFGDVRPYYLNGRGSFINKGVIEDSTEHKNELIIREIPYEMGGAVNGFIENVKELISSNKLPGVIGIDDYTSDIDNDENKTSIIITLQPKVDKENIKAMLFSKTSLQRSYNPIWMALDNKQPILFNLISYLRYYSNFQNRLIVREFAEIDDLNSKRLNIINALLTIEKNLKPLIFAAQNTSGKPQLISVLQGVETIDGLKKKFSYNPEQAEMLASLRIYQLNHINIENLKTEQIEVIEKIKFAKLVQSDNTVRSNILCERIDLQIAHFSKLGFKTRKTELKDGSELTAYQEIENKTDVTISIDRYGYIKTVNRKNIPLSEDIVQVINTSTNDVLSIFTNTGKMMQFPISNLKVYGNRDNSRGDSLHAVFTKNGIQPTEQILCVTTKTNLENEKTQLVFISKKGSTKRTPTANSKYITKTIRKSIIAWKPKFENDELILAILVSEDEIDNNNNQIIALSDQNTVKRIKLNDISEMGPTGSGSNTLIPDKKGIGSIDQIYTLDALTSTYVISHMGATIDLMSQPLIKPTMTYKKIKITDN